MTRGHLKYKNRTVGNKAARGNGSRRATFHRTPGYQRKQNATATRHANASMKNYTDECIRGGLDYFLVDDDVAYYDEIEEEYENPPLRDETISFVCHEDVAEQCFDKYSRSSVNINHSVGRMMEDDNSSNSHDRIVMNDLEDLTTDEEYDTFEMVQRFDLQHPSNVRESEVQSKGSVSSYSLCDVPGGDSHSSFSYIGSTYSDNGSVSYRSSTIWDFIEHSIGLSSSTLVRDFSLVEASKYVYLMP